MTEVVNVRGIDVTFKRIFAGYLVYAGQENIGILRPLIEHSGSRSRNRYQALRRLSSGDFAVGPLVCVWHESRAHAAEALVTELEHYAYGRRLLEKGTQA